MAFRSTDTTNDFYLSPFIIAKIRYILRHKRKY